MTGEDLTALALAVREHLGPVTASEVAEVAKVVLGRASRRVGRPVAYVARAVAMDIEAWTQWLAGHRVTSGGHHTTGGRAGGPEGVRTPSLAAVPASGRTGGRRPCPVPRHAESQYLATNCPSCRFGDFPKRLDTKVFDALDTSVRARVLEAGVTVPGRSASGGSAGSEAAGDRGEAGVS
ncbi:hypothetical protein [Nesterenkonia marinintestina]|uniref:hypothetical protein n=1 Tax=Nesterenkonia marinintestina TaxID=2979865 RepID=UPI0021C02044|nr:hypothetical protein [Nesterenkonia sp. GX14115]